MKIIDISSFDIVKTGIEFHVVTSSKESTAVAELLPNMERNEGAVFWLQPKNGTVEQQEACICVNGVYYALNSKFEKAIFRNVRLTRDFKNLERLVDGTRMMIVLLLFLQKQSLAFAVYLFGIGTLHTGPGLKKKTSTCDNALTMTSPVHW
jgi:hypothetical protein